MGSPFSNRHRSLAYRDAIRALTFQRRAEQSWLATYRGQGSSPACVIAKTTDRGRRDPGYACTIQLAVWSALVARVQVPAVVSSAHRR